MVSLQSTRSTKSKVANLKNNQDTESVHDDSSLLIHSTNSNVTFSKDKQDSEKVQDKPSNMTQVHV